MTTLPDEIVTRIVHGRYIVPIIDGADPDQRPDAIPAKGSFAFISSLGYIPVFETTEGPVTMLNVPIIGVLDDDGYLCTPIPGTMDPMYRGVTLYTTDNPVLAVTDWTWNVVYKFDAHGSTALSIPAHGFALPSGLPVDLTTLAKVPSSPGYGLPQAEAALLRAEQAAQDSAIDAAAAVEAAGRAEAAAGATDTGVAALLGDPLTDTGGLLEDKLAVKADTATVYETFSTKADLDGGLVPDAQTPAGVTLALNDLSEDKADKSTVENSLAFKADLVDGLVPQSQLPAPPPLQLTEDPADPGFYLIGG